MKHPDADPEQRNKFIENIKKYEQEKRNIVYIDESGFSESMPRTHGYSIKGTRCYGEHSWGKGKRTNAIGAQINNKLLTVSLFRESITADIFSAWVEHDLLPKLPQRSVLVLDNASFHKRKDIQISINTQKHTLEYLPTYSPDLNKIEQKWAMAKSKRRKYGCSIDELFQKHVL